MPGLEGTGRIGSEPPSLKCVKSIGSEYELCSGAVGSEMGIIPTIINLMMIVS